jgi:predicted DNA-binding protein with PD1-like motif
MQVRAWPGTREWFALRLEPGEPLFPTLEGFAEDQGLASGFVTAGLGSLRGSTLGFFDGKRYRKRTFPGALELVSLTGSLARVDGRPHFHLHATLGDEAHRARGGHLHEATVAVLAEVLFLAGRGMAFGRNPQGPQLRVLDLWPPGEGPSSPAQGGSKRRDGPSRVPRPRKRGDT